jgi:hypothetical protein
LRAIVIEGGTRRETEESARQGGFVREAAVRDFELVVQSGNPWRLEDALAQGAVVLLFYRGDW